MARRFRKGRPRRRGRGICIPSSREESQRQGLPFVGRMPLTMDPGDAAALGQRSIEHLMQVPLACSSEETELRRRLRTWRAAGGWLDHVARSVVWRLWYRDLPNSTPSRSGSPRLTDSVKAAALFEAICGCGFVADPDPFPGTRSCTAHSGNGIRTRKPVRAGEQDAAAESAVYPREQCAKRSVLPAGTADRGSHVSGRSGAAGWHRSPDRACDSLVTVSMRNWR